MNSVAFSPDGRVFSGGADGTIWVWDGASAKEFGESVAGMVTKNFRISSFRPTSPKNAPRGYRRTDFEDAWRYMAPLVKQTGDSGDAGDTGDGEDENVSRSAGSAGFSGLFGIGVNADRLCLVCGRSGADTADVCAHCRSVYETACKPPADVAAAIGKMLSEVATRPRFQSGNDRIRDTQ